MDIQVNEQAIGFGLYQSLLAVVGVLILIVLTWRTARAIQNRLQGAGSLGQRDVLALAWPPVLWVTILIVGAIIYSGMQPYGPRVAIPRTPLTVNPTVAPKEGVRDLTPGKTTDAERLKQQRALEDETKKRVNLP